jgi:hypothetical protein
MRDHYGMQQELQLANIASSRDCGECTACCDGWLATIVDGCAVKPGSPCKHISPKGCKIYAVRPVDPCVKFMCGWMLDSSMPAWLRPSESKAIIVANLVWERPSNLTPVHGASAVGEHIPAKTIKWLKKYASRQGCNFLCNEPVMKGTEFVGEIRWFGVGSPEFERDVADWMEAGYPFYTKISGSTLIYR